MNLYRLILCLTLFSWAYTKVYPQQTKVVSAEYTYHAPENISPEQAKNIAIERAKLQAIESEFGTVVQRTNTVIAGTKEGKAHVDYFSLGESEVKGEWLETIEEPEIFILNENNQQIVVVKIKGRIREIIHAPIDIEAKLLCNGTESRFESEDFKNGDDLYLSFHSPTDGFLAVYLVDATQTAYCLLPYRNQKEGICQIKANESYLFFSSKHAIDIDKNIVDEYVMTTNQAMEINRIYVVFSPNSFCKAVDNDSASETLPRELSFKDFQKWLVKCRKSDVKMQVINKEIAIKSTNN